MLERVVQDIILPSITCTPASERLIFNKGISRKLWKTFIRRSLLPRPKEGPEALVMSTAVSAMFYARLERRLRLSLTIRRQSNRLSQHVLFWIPRNTGNRILRVG